MAFVISATFPKGMLGKTHGNENPQGTDRKNMITIPKEEAK
jgi:hypothetical protein